MPSAQARLRKMVAASGVILQGALERDLDEAG